MVLPFWESLLGIAVTVVLAVVAVSLGAFTAWSGVVAAVFASIIVVLAGWPYFALLLLFVIGSALATRYGFDEKRRTNLQEGTHGERGISNVLAHILIPVGLTLLAVAAPTVFPLPVVAVLFSAALAFGAADTFASELGVLSGRARSILTGRRVIPGTNGGVSIVGETWAAAGAATTAVLALLLFGGFADPVPPPLLLVGAVSLAGFGACQVDSVLGEALENRGELTKHGTNFLAMLSSVGIAAGLLLAGGYPL